MDDYRLQHKKPASASADGDGMVVDSKLATTTSNYTINRSSNVTSSSHMDSGGHFLSGSGGGSCSMHMPSAADSLTALSLPYQHVATHDHHHHHQTAENTSNPGPESMRIMRGSSVSYTGIVTTGTGSIIHHSTQQSSNSRSKNFNFVPISPGPQSPRVGGPMHSSIGGHAGNRNTFLSSRRSPAV